MSRSQSRALASGSSTVSTSPHIYALLFVRYHLSPAFLCLTITLVTEVVRAFQSALALLSQS